ncbi:MAG TPA: uracil phosphoribosyltransferase, partial [Ktedonobacterales bacterium]|nr:uracil phosphoribosyltransferase [Ktedonobacterales bacterium]
MQDEQATQRVLPMLGVPQPTREEVLSLPEVHISRHPVVAAKLTALRDKQTPSREFYRLVRELGTLLAYEATANLRL